MLSELVKKSEQTVQLLHWKQDGMELFAHDGLHCTSGAPQIQMN